MCGDPRSRQARAVISRKIAIALATPESARLWPLAGYQNESQLR
jgi:hypothetical protein